MALESYEPTPRRKHRMLPLFLQDEVHLVLFVAVAAIVGVVLGLSVARAVAPTVLGALFPETARSVAAAKRDQADRAATLARLGRDCPEIRPALVRALADDVVTRTEARGVADRADVAAAESRRIAATNAARAAAGLPARPDPSPCAVRGHDRQTRHHLPRTDPTT